MTKKGEKWMYKHKNTTKRGFETKRKAQLHFAEHLKKDKSELVENTITITITQLADEWFEDYIGSGVKKSTIYARKNKSLPKIKDLLGNVILSELKGTDIENFYKTLKLKGISKNTLYSIKTVLSLIINFAVKQGYINYNIVKSVKLPMYPKTITELKENIEDNYFTTLELLNFLDVTSESNDIVIYTLFKVMAYTGMRIGEALALTVKDIDFVNKKIHIYKTLYREYNSVAEYEVTPPKTIKSARKIDISIDLIKQLESLANYLENLRKNIVFYEEELFLFVYLKNGFWGYPLTKEYVNNKIKKYTRKAGIEKNMSSHKFRHTHISLMAEAGVSLPVIQKRVGHSDRIMTEEIYLHITSDMNIDSVVLLDELLKNKSWSNNGQKEK